MSVRDWAIIDRMYTGRARIRSVDDRRWYWRHVRWHVVWINTDRSLLRCLRGQRLLSLCLW